MNDFDECGIRYLTASSIDMYRDNPGAWVMRYLYGLQTGSAALARTIAVRSAAKHWIYGESLGNVEDRLDEFFQVVCADRGVDIHSPDARSEHSTLLALFTRTVQALQQLGVGHNVGKLPLAAGLPHSVWADGLEAPFLAAPAFVFQDFTLELKWGKRCYTDVQPRDLGNLAVQSRVYRDRPQKILYITHSKDSCPEIAPERLEAAWAALVVDALALQTFIKTATTREHALAMVPVNPSQFRWDGPTLTRAGEILALTQERLNGIARTENLQLRDPGAGDVLGDLLQDS